jgi:glycosyltransferase involved in cell wall biosynthesis
VPRSERTGLPRASLLLPEIPAIPVINRSDPDYANVPGRRPLPAQYSPIALPARGTADVSILTPYFNTEALFAETLTSVLAQSLQNWEWVIVDDGSTDPASVARLKDLTGDDPRVRVIRQDNAGPAAARNRAYDNSRGRYVCLLDSDDMIEPTYLEKCMWFLDSNPEFAFCNAYSVVFGDEHYLWRNGFDRGEAHLDANSGPPISVIRRQAYCDAGGFDAAIRLGHEDWDFWLRMAKAGHWGYTIGEYLQWYRKRASGRFEQLMSAGDLGRRFEEHIRVVYKGLRTRFPHPRRRTPEPYQTVPTNWDASNPLALNPNGRRILFLVPWMTIGGADRVNLDLIDGLVGHGHNVTVCATLRADHVWAYKFAQLTPDVFILPSFLHLSDYPRFLAYLIASRGIDSVVITGSTLGYQLVPYLRAAAPRTVFVDLSHVEEPHWLNGGHPRFGVGYQDALDLNIVSTGHLAEWMSERGADRARIRVLYTGVRPARPDPDAVVRQRIRSYYGVPAEMPLIVFAGRICEQKRPALLAEILKSARDAGVDFHALIIGHGELQSTLAALIRKYRLKDHVAIVPSVSHEQWLDTLLAAEILLMPSLYEGISVALLEAMAAGVVPVVARVGGQDEIVPADAGYLIPRWDGELADYVQALSRLTDGSPERAAKSRVCRAAVASTHSWEKTIDGLERILDEAQAAIPERRCHFTLPIGCELATLALEYQRLGDSFNWFGRVGSQGDAQPTLSSGPMARLVVQFADTAFGRWLLASPGIKRVGRAIVYRLLARRQEGQS